MARNFDSEYKAYHSSEKQKKARASRNAARRIMEKEGKVHKGDNNDVDHSNGRATDNKRSNLKVKPKSENRSYPRTKSARKKNPKD